MPSVTTVMQLVQERNHSLVAFNWQHERDHLVALAEKLSIKYGVIDGSTAASKRKDIVDRMQAGQLQVVFATRSLQDMVSMTKATTVIWASPTTTPSTTSNSTDVSTALVKPNAQKSWIAAQNTWEPAVYDKPETKLSRMDELLGILNQTTSIREAS